MPGSNGKNAHLEGLPPHYPLDSHSKSGYVRADQVILPSFLSAPLQSGVMNSSNATLVTVPALGGESVSNGLQQQQQQQQQEQAPPLQQRWGSEGARSDFGISQRAVGPAPTSVSSSSLVSSGISIHAKPYYYRSGRNSGGGLVTSSRHQQHREHNWRQQADPFDGASTMTPTSANYAKKNNSTSNNYSNHNDSGRNASIKFTTWRASGGIAPGNGTGSATSPGGGEPVGRAEGGSGGASALPSQPLLGAGNDNAAAA
ncbi:hypothetical protein DQ04_17301010, partial [Trypanosoma grayi]|uniref:hypothetical protein n=1 Tax=Trypanosoma grayi TaxID=71804 RepID=UPI0004F4701F